MTSSPAGYSGKPLHSKLGLKPRATCLLIKPPDHYMQLVEDAEDVRFARRKCQADVVHVFCRRQKDLAPLFERALASVVEGGMVWISWPKKSSEMYVDLTEQDLRDHILPMGWVDVKVCAVDQDWSGLKFVRRRAGQ